MKKFLQVFAFFCFAGIFISANHPVYLTVTEIEHNATAHSLEISCKFYIEDLENTLKDVYNTKVDLMATSAEATNGKLINAYVAKHLSLKINDQPVNLKFVGIEVDKDAVFAFFEVNQVNSLKKLSVHQDLLFAQYEEQLGIIHMKAAGKTKSTKLQNPEADASFAFPL